MAQHDMISMKEKYHVAACTQQWTRIYITCEQQARNQLLLKLRPLQPPVLQFTLAPVASLSDTDGEIWPGPGKVALRVFEIPSL